MLVCLIFEPTLIIIFLLPLPFIQQNLRCDPWLCHLYFLCLPLLISALLLGMTSSNLSVLAADICILGLTVPASFHLVDVRILVFPLNSPESTTFWSPGKGLSSTFIFWGVSNLSLPSRIAFCMLPENFAFISGMRSSIMELAELLILQLIRG